MAKTLACGRALPQKHKRKISPEFKEFLREKLQAYIKANQLNQSDSRNQILDILLSQNEHFSIGDLIKRVTESSPHIGTATVYRNVAVFLESGLLRETLTDEQGQKVYEINEEDHHDHIVCLDCGQIFEFHDEGIEKAQEKLSQSQRFEAIHHSHVIYAHCKVLQK